MTILPHQRPGLSKRRSRRLRKKLHIAEFQELGFEYEATWHSHPTMDQQDAFLDAFVALIESRDLQLGGGPTTGVVCGVRKNPDSSDVEAVREFLAAWTGIERVTIGKMVDAWYDDLALSALADSAKGAADRAGSAIDEAATFIEASNERIRVMEKVRG